MKLWLVRAWVVAVAVLLLGPALFPGYVLSYDMVWVPDLAIRSDFFGLGSGIPRAVPSDALIALLDEVIPGMVLQKVILLGSLVAGGLGIQRWVSPEAPTWGSAAAATFYLWNPYVVERLAIGHWPMVVCAGVLPWIGLSLRRSVREGRVRPELLVLVPLGSLNASAGLATGVVVAAFVWQRAAGRRLLLLSAGVVLVANLPWVVAGLTKAGVMGSAAASSRLFAPAAEGPLPAFLTPFTLGGIWNSEVVPTSRMTALVWVSLAVLALSIVTSRRRLGQSDVRRWWIPAGVGIGLAVLGAVAPGVIGAVAEHVPGFGVLRDASRLLVLAVPLTAIALGHAVNRWSRLAGEAGPIVGVACMLVPVAMLPDAAWGLGGDLRAVRYPASYDAMAHAVAASPEHGDVLVLPFTSYRAPAWNGDRKVFDPVGRFQGRNYLASDSLAISGRQLPAEDPRGRRVVSALALTTPAERSSALSDLGVGIVVTDRSVAKLPGQEPYFAVVDGTDGSVPGFDVVTIRGVRSVQVGTLARWLITGAWAAYFVLLCGGCARGLAQIGHKLRNR